MTGRRLVPAKRGNAIFCRRRAPALRIAGRRGGRRTSRRSRAGPPSPRLAVAKKRPAVSVSCDPQRSPESEADVKRQIQMAIARAAPAGAARPAALRSGDESDRAAPPTSSTRRAPASRGSRAKAKTMRRTVFAGVIACALAVGVPPVAATPGPAVTFTLLTPLPTDLSVGETAVIGVRAESSVPFVMAIALSDAYYPGRGVLFDGSSAVAHSTSADLYLTITGRESTAGLAAVENWPADEDWPAGVAPVAVRAGARFAGGQVASASFVFAVRVS